MSLFNSKIRINLGSGGQKVEGFLGMDIRNLPGVDIVRDILRGLPFADETVDEIYSENFLEHIPQAEVIWVMNEMWRVLKPGGISRHIIPLVGTDNDWQDPSHLSRWGIETFRYFDRENKKSGYYGSDIKSWCILKLEIIPGGRAIEVILTK